MSQNDTELTPKRARSILTRLRAGQPPEPRDVQRIQVGREAEKRRLCDKKIEGLPCVREGNGQLFYVLGDFGYGKTFFINLLAREATDREFMYSKFAIQDIRDIEDKGDLYEAIASNIQYPDERGTGLVPLLRQFCEQTDRSQFGDVATRFDMAGDPIYEILDNLLEAWTEGEMYVPRDDITLSRRQVLDGAASYLSGDEVSLEKKHAIGRVGGGTILTKEQNKLYRYLKHITSIGLSVGYSGSVILIDEGAEQMEWSDETNIDQRLIDLFNKCTDEFGHMMFVFVGNEERWDWLIDKAGHQALTQRYPQKKVVLDDLERQHYIELVQKVGRIIEVGESRRIGLSESDAEEIVESAAAKHGGIGSLSPRSLLLSPDGGDEQNTLIEMLTERYGT